jgi:PAS domain S-box-containing protein
MESSPRSSALRYSVAILTVWFALFVTLQVELIAARTPFALFFAAVMVSTWYGGRNPGLFAIALSALLSDYFIVSPHLSLLRGHDNVLQLSTFILVALLINSLTSARQRSEKSLRESEERYRLLFENNPLPMWVYDLETLAFLAVNEAAVQCYGYSREEFLSMTIKDIRPAEDIPALLNSVASAPCGLDAAGTWRHRKKSGAVIDVEITSHTINFGGRQAEIVLANDITERARVEMSLRENEARLQTIVESLTEGLAVANLDGQLLHFNRAALEMHGFASLDECRRHLTKFADIFELSTTDGSVLPMGQWPLARILRGENLRDIEVCIRHTEDDWQRVFNYGGTLVYDDGGQPLMAVVTISNITERKQAEESLQAKNEELAALTQQFWQASRLAVMGELAASIAHELNNPLATISLRTESLLAQAAEGDPQRRPLEIIDQEVERMGGLVGNLLQFSRRSHQQISTMDVREEIANTLEFIHYHLRKHRINVVREFADIIPTVQADRQQLRQLFLNLLTNASDAMPQGGRLTVRVNAGQLEHGAGSVIVEFEDTGTGIAPDDLAKVWEPFFTTKPEGRGTGLGLAICRRIVEEHGGTMHIESAVGQGTTVRIVLPATNGEKR